MKKLDWIIISSISIIAIILTIILVSNKKIDADSVDISVVFKSEEIYKLSIDDEGLYYISVKDNHLTLTKNELILFEKDVDNKDFTNTFKIEKQKVEMINASCDGKDCTKMYITKKHLLPIICTNGVVLEPVSNTNIDIIS